MVVAIVDWTALLKLGAEAWATVSVDLVPVPETRGCVLVWQRDASAVPDAVVVADGALSEFFAWTSTYAPHLAPISALAKVVEHSECPSLAATGAEAPASATPDPKVMRGYLGLVHAEVVAANWGSAAPANAGLTPYLSTFSWSALQRSLAGSPSSSLAVLRERWEDAHRALEAENLGYEAAAVQEVWELIGGSADDLLPVEGEIREFLRSVRDRSPRPRVLTPSRDQEVALQSLQVGPLEGRVELFKQLARELCAPAKLPAANAVVIGYALSLISQGSFAHTGLLGPSQISDVRPLLWYGWFDFLTHEPTAGSPSASAATLQLVRAVDAHRVGCRRDVALQELLVLQRPPHSDCLLDRRHPIWVELSREVVCLVQPTQRSSGKGRKGQQRRLFEE